MNIIFFTSLEIDAIHNVIETKKLFYDKLDMERQLCESY